MKRLIAEDPGCVNRIHHEGFGALHLACSQGHAKVVGCLIDKGANPYLQSKSPYFKYSLTPLQFSCWQGHVDVVEVLLLKGVDPCALVSGALLNTVLKTACCATRVEVVRCLLRNQRVRMVMLDDYHCGFQTALDIAASSGNAELVELLLGTGADPYVGFDSRHHVINGSRFDPSIESVRLFRVSLIGPFGVRHDVPM